MSQIVTGFLGAKPGDGPYFSPRFRVTQKSNAKKFYRKTKPTTILDIDDYLTHIDMTSNNDFDIEDILSPRYAEFGYVRAYKARLRRHGFDPKQLFNVNRHMETPRSSLTSLPKLNRRFLVQKNSGVEQETMSRLDEDLLIDPYTKIKEKSQISRETNSKQPSDLDKRIKTLEENSTIDGFISRQKQYGRPLGSLFSDEFLLDMLQEVEQNDNNKRRSSIFYRTEVANT